MIEMMILKQKLEESKGHIGAHLVSVSQSVIDPVRKHGT